MTHADEGGLFCKEKLNDFLDYKKQISKLKDEIVAYETRIEATGRNTKETELKEKVEEHSKYENLIRRNKKDLKDQKTLREEAEEDLASIEAKIKKASEHKDEINDLEKSLKFSKRLSEIIQKTKDEHLKDLLNNVNKSATSYLRNVTTDSQRFHRIEIDTDYEINIYTKDGFKLSWDNDDINKGNAQTAILGFVVGVSEHIDKSLPFVMDNPLMRLDEDFEEGTVVELCKRTHQLILHLIPKKEYDDEVFNDIFKPRLNSQNFIHRVEGTTAALLDDKIATIDNYETAEMIPYRSFRKKHNYEDK